MKETLLPKGRSICKIRAGIARGIRMELDLQSQLQRYLGLDERELVPSVLHLTSICPSCIDVGANDGYYTLVFLRSSAEQIVACEPGPVLDRLMRNAEANGFIANERFGIETRLIGQAADQMPVRRLIHDLPGPVLVKVDVDGAELDVLESARGSDRLAELYWIVETHSVELEANCKLWFERHGYRTSIVKNAWWRVFVPERRPVEQNRWLVAEPK